MTADVKNGYIIRMPNTVDFVNASPIVTPMNCENLESFDPMAIEFGPAFKLLELFRLDLKIKLRIIREKSKKYDVDEESHIIIVYGREFHSFRKVDNFLSRKLRSVCREIEKDRRMALKVRAHIL